MTPSRIPLETVALAGAVAFLALALRPSETFTPAEPEGDGALYAPPWNPPEDLGLPTAISPPFPGGHTEFDNQILYACGLYRMTDPLAPLLVKAIIRWESGWNPRAFNPSPRELSKGLMQVNTVAHPDLDRAYDLFEPNQNILAGCIVLAGAYRTHWPDIESVLETYNGGGPWTRGTTDYAANVLSILRGFAAEVGIAV